MLSKNEAQERIKRWGGTHVQVIITAANGFKFMETTLLYQKHEKKRWVMIDSYSDGPFVGTVTKVPVMLEEGIVEIVAEKFIHEI